MVSDPIVSITLLYTNFTAKSVAKVDPPNKAPSKAAYGRSLFSKNTLNAVKAAAFNNGIVTNSAMSCLVVLIFYFYIRIFCLLLYIIIEIKFILLIFTVI